MGSYSSKPETSEALHLCKSRMRFIKQAVDSRYALSAAHLAYIQSLRSMGTNLYRFVEAEMLTESSLSTTSELDKSPSRYSCASISPPHPAENATPSPVSPIVPNVSYMRSGVSSTVTVKLDLPPSHLVGDDSLNFSLPPPPPPLPPEIGSSWDFFDPADVKAAGWQNGETQGNSHSGADNCIISLRKFPEGDTVFDEVDTKFLKVHPVEMKQESHHIDKGSESAVNLLSNDGIDTVSTTVSRTFNDSMISNQTDLDAINNSPHANKSYRSHEPKGGKAEDEKEQYREREDPSEFITHRAKDFLSSIKDIEHWFFRAAESGTDLLKMLEANKIRLNSHLKKMTARSTTACAPSIHPSCCRRGTSAGDQKPVQNMTAKVITWNRSVSSMSSSSRIPLVSAVKDDCDNSSDFAEQHCMISGSHSSSLERLYAWERKLYDEVNLSEAIQKRYNRRCCQLRQQFARDMNAHVIDKTRAIVKDLHSQLRVALQTVDFISRRIEKLRDEEVLPQLAELVQGLIGMWKAMLTCHHTQYIIISLAYQMKSGNSTTKSESYRQVVGNLMNETTCFASSSAMLMNAQKDYVDALNMWLQNCILQPQERSRGRRTAFSPRRAIAPPIFVLCRDWSSRMNSLPSEDLSEAINALTLEIQAGFHHTDKKQKGDPMMQPVHCPEPRGEKQQICCQNLADLQACLTRVFDQLRKFAEASLKMYEEIKESFEAAHVSYTNGWIRYKT